MNSLAFERFHPLTNFLYYLGAVSLIMVMKHPLYYVASLCLLIGLNILVDKLQQVKSWWKVFLIMSLFILIVNPLINHRGNTILFYIGSNSITLEAAVSGVVLACSLIAILLLFTTYNRIITPNKFIYLFGRILPQTALLLMLSMRFVPLLRRRLKEITLVQASRGRSMSQGSLTQRARSGIDMVQILLTWSLEEALQTADSMKARGYGARNRSQYQAFLWRKKDTFLVLVMILLFLPVIVLTTRGVGVLEIYPALQAISFKMSDWVSFTLYSLFISLPLLLEGREVIRWRTFN